MDKIYAGERFSAYIVIPMFPEGDPTSAPILEILVNLIIREKFLPS